MLVEPCLLATKSSFAIVDVLMFWKVTAPININGTNSPKPGPSTSKEAEKTTSPASSSAAASVASNQWRPTARWAANWHAKLPLQTIMRLLQVLVPQVEKICIDKCVPPPVILPG